MRGDRRKWGRRPVGSAASGRLGWADFRRGRRGFRQLSAGGACPGAERLDTRGVRVDHLLRAQRAGLLHGAVVAGAVVHAALERAAVGQRGEERSDEVGGDVLVDPMDGCIIVQEYTNLAMRVTNQCAAPTDPNASASTSAT